MTKKAKILVVDDNEQNLYMMKALLEGYGYDFIQSGNGIEALDAVKQKHPDLIISDILMPGLDGFGFCRKLKSDEDRKKIPLIFYTATYTDAKDEEFALSLGAERFVRKPTDPVEFNFIIGDVLKKYKEGKLIPVKKELEEEEIFYKKYNAALIRKMEEKMVELETINKRLIALFHTSVDLASFMLGQGLITVILTKVIEVIECSHVNYFEFNENDETLELKVIIGSPERNVEKYKNDLTFKLGEERGLVGLIALNHEPLILENTMNDPRWIRVDKSINSALFLPMISEGHLIGVLSFLDTEPGKFDEQISRDMTILANNLAIAIEKKRYIEKIQESEHRYRALFENSIDAIISVDKEGNITDWSRGAEELFGYSRDEQVGASVESILPEKDKQSLERIFKEVRKNGFMRKWETPMLTKDKQVINVEMTFTDLGRDMGYTTILRDAGEQK